MLRYQKVAVSEVSGITVVDGIPVMEGKVAKHALQTPNTTDI